MYTNSFQLPPLPCCCCLNIKCLGAVCRYGQSALVHLQRKEHTWFTFHMYRPAFSMATNRKQPVTRLLDIIAPPNVILHQPHSQVPLHWNCEGEECIVSCLDHPRTCKREGLVFWATFLVTAPRSESSNQIVEHVILCDDVHVHCRQASIRSTV